MKKKLRISCAVCDLRKITEEKVQAYEEIKVNAACVITSPEAKKLLLGTNVSINTAQELELDENANLILKNGTFDIKKNSLARPNDFLLVNGSLEIEPGALEAAQSYMKIMVNGQVTCPESIVSAVSSMIVNGSTSYYPDDKIMFNGNIDKLFLMRLSEGDEYYTENTVYMLDDIDYSPLEKVKIQAPGAYIPESCLTVAAKVFPRSANIVVLPDGVERIRCEELTSDTVKQYGKKLFIESDVKLADKEALESLEYLRISGKAYVKKDLLPLSKCVESACLMPYADKIINDCANVYIDRAVLENAPVLVTDCANVEIKEEVPAELISERLTIIGCALIRCSEEQMAAVSGVSQDIAAIMTGDEPDNCEEPDPNIDTVSAALYSL